MKWFFSILNHINLFNEIRSLLQPVLWYLSYALHFCEIQPEVQSFCNGFQNKDVNTLDKTTVWIEMSKWGQNCNQSIYFYCVVWLCFEVIRLTLNYNTRYETTGAKKMKDKNCLEEFKGHHFSMDFNLKITWMNENTKSNWIKPENVSSYIWNSYDKLILDIINSILW